MGDQGWCTIESDPGVFTTLLTEIGVKNIQVEELYTLDRSHLSTLGKIHGLIFLFRYRENETISSTNRGEIVAPPKGLFFARQTIHNACATVALLQIVMNADVDAGDELSRFREFTSGMDPGTVGMVLSNSEKIRGVHNSFTPTQMVVENVPMEKEEAFHFIAYIPHDGTVYELDGLQEGPRRVGDGGDWVDIAAGAVEKRIAEYDGKEIRFNMMAVVEDPREGIRKELEGGVSEEKKKVLEGVLRGEEERHKRWEMENVRRRWNFVPTVVELCKVLAEAGVMEGLIEGVTQKKKQALAEGDVEEVKKDVSK